MRTKKRRNSFGRKMRSKSRVSAPTRRGRKQTMKMRLVGKVVEADEEVVVVVELELVVVEGMGLELEEEMKWVS